MVEINERGLKAIPDGFEPFLEGAGWVCTQIAGQILQTKETAWLFSEEYRLFAIEMSCLLDLQVAHDGKWVVGWTDIDPALPGHPRQLLMGWIDKDGDLRVLVDCEDPFPILCQAKLEYAEQCSAAYREHLSHLLEVGVTPDQTIKAAQGQRSIDEGVFPSI